MWTCSNVKPLENKCTLFECQSIKHESTNWDTNLRSRRDRHFTWSSEPREGLAAYSAKGVPPFSDTCILRP